MPACCSSATTPVTESTHSGSSRRPVTPRMELGLSRLRARLADLQHPLLPDEPAPARTAILRRDGKYWTIGLDNQLTMPQNVTLLDLVSTVSR